MRRRIATTVLLAGALAVLLSAGILALGLYRFAAPGPLTEERVLVIPKGASVGDIAAQLAREGVIGDPFLFRLAARLTGVEHGLRAGEYAFSPHLSVQGALALLAGGTTVLRRFTVPEGMTSREVHARLALAEGLEGEVVVVPGEGELLPETYLYTYGDSRNELVARMREAMRKTVAELWVGRAEGLPLTDPGEAVALASIVERETAIPEERPRIAAVYLNRLRRGMRLEADPTVAYGLAGEDGVPRRELTEEDLVRPTPFNTYLRPGLPPTPIANPGRAALAAVLSPAETDDLYFVADGSGGHVFARTLEEHGRNVRRWRRLQRDRRAR